MDYNDYPTPTNLEAEEWRKETLRLDAELKQSKADVDAWHKEAREQCERAEAATKEATRHYTRAEAVTSELANVRLCARRESKVEAGIGGGIRVVSCLKGHLTTQPKNDHRAEGLWTCGKCGEIAAEFTTVNYPEAAAAPAAVAVELAQLSRELVQHSREMREQEKKIVELEDLIKNYKAQEQCTIRYNNRLHEALRAVIGCPPDKDPRKLAQELHFSSAVDPELK